MGDLVTCAERIAKELTLSNPDLIDESQIMAHIEEHFPTNETGPSGDYIELERDIGFELIQLGYQETRAGGCFTRLRPQDLELESYHPKFNPA